MSLSRETLDQLLSGYMDEALSEDERVQLEELLRTDPDVAGELNELRQLRDSLQFISRADSMISLEVGFADRVLDAAVQRARAEGLSEDHPVMRLSEQPSANSRSRSGGGSTPIWRVTGIVAALAASVALAFVFWGPRNSNDTVSIADSEMINSVPELETSDAQTVLAADAMSDAPSESAPSDSLAADRMPSDPITSDSFTAPSPTEELIDSAIVSTDRVAIDTGASQTALIDMSIQDDAFDAPRTLEITRPATTKIASSPQRRVGAVMVLEVNRTEAGRMSRAVRSALRDAAITIQNKKLIAEDIVGVMQAADRDEDESLSGASVLYLEGTAKQLDRFILSLCGDQQGIDTVRFGLASELPILNLVQKLQRPIDPKSVRHTTSWSVQADSPEASRALTGVLVARTMAPLNTDAAALGVIPSAKEDGPDVMSELFVVVR